MRSILTMLAVGVSACASHAAHNTAQPVKVDASNVVELQKAGYIIKDENGKRLYCTRETMTGSHIETRTACLTQREWEQIREDTQRAMHQISTPQPPPPPSPGK